MKIECKAYIFWHKHPADVETPGSCRKYPPTRDNYQRGAFPIAMPDWWCGEFAPLATQARKG